MDNLKRFAEAVGADIKRLSSVIQEDVVTRNEFEELKNDAKPSLPSMVEFAAMVGEKTIIGELESDGRLERGYLKVVPALELVILDILITEPYRSYSNSMPVASFNVRFPNANIEIRDIVLYNDFGTGSFQLTKEGDDIIVQSTGFPVNDSDHGVLVNYVFLNR